MHVGARSEVPEEGDQRVVDDPGHGLAAAAWTGIGGIPQMAVLEHHPLVEHAPHRHRLDRDLGQPGGVQRFAPAGFGELPVVIAGNQRHAGLRGQSLERIESDGRAERGHAVRRAERTTGRGIPVRTWCCHHNRRPVNRYQGVIARAARRARGNRSRKIEVSASLGAPLASAPSPLLPVSVRPWDVSKRTRTVDQQFG